MPDKLFLNAEDVVKIMGVAKPTVNVNTLYGACVCTVCHARNRRRGIRGTLRSL